MKPMLKRACCLSLLLSLIAIASVQAACIVPPEVDIISDYMISVELIPEEKRLVGVEEVAWTNPGQKPVSELYFYLYPNAFSPGATFLAERGIDGERLKQPGRMTITQLTVDGQPCDFAFVQPDDNNKSDRTVARVRLPDPVEPGAKVRLHFGFAVDLPAVVARMGYYENFFMIAQWYPKIAAYEKAGVRGRDEEGWNVHQYHGNSEFYGNFARFNVAITVPKEFTVAACGNLKAKETLGDKSVYYYEAVPVHTFSWMADESVYYEDRQYMWGNHPVQVHLYLQPQLSEQAGDYFDAIDKCMRFYHDWLGSYPYDDLTVIIPEAGASGAAGMEYPTLVLGAEARLTLENRYGLETLVHELAHQYFYGLVATNEMEEPWLDEGFTSYITTKALSEVFNHKYFKGFAAEYIRPPQPLTLSAWDYESFHNSYALNVYTRAELVLAELEQQIGTDTMKKFLRTYVSRYSFGHPGTADVQQVLEEVAGKSFDRFFEKHVYGSAMQDFRIESLQCSRNSRGRYTTAIEVYHHNIEREQITLLLELADGSTQTYTYRPGTVRQTLTVDTKQAVRGVYCDPELNRLFLDNQLLNNGLELEAPIKKASWFSLLIELILGWIGG